MRIVYAALLALAACRSPTNGASLGEATSADLSAPGKALLVYMGGFNSCRRGTPLKLAAINELSKVRDAVTAAGFEARWVLTCYDGMSSTVIRWTSSADPEKVFGIAWNEPGRKGELFDEVTNLTDDLTVPLFIVGHSYGGWLAANLAAYIGRAPNGRGAVHGLFTIDPISPYHCNQISYAATIAKAQNHFSWLMTENGCQHAPIQLSTKDGATYPGLMRNDSDGVVHGLIRTSARLWRNFYQDRDFLHSSAVPVTANLPENTHIPFGTFVLGLTSTPHTKIHVSADVWNAIRGTTLQRLGAPVPVQGLALQEVAPPSAAAEGDSVEPYKEQIEQALAVKKDGGALTPAEQAKIEAIYGAAPIALKSAQQPAP